VCVCVCGGGGCEIVPTPTVTAGKSVTERSLFLVFNSINPHGYQGNSESE
jgi:hypothetical protein